MAGGAESTTIARGEVEVLAAENARLRALLARAGIIADAAADAARREIEDLREEAASTAQGHARALAASAAELRSASDLNAALSRLNAALRASQAFVGRVLAASRDWISVLDRDAAVLMVSEGGRAVLMPVDATDFVGRAWPELWEGTASREAAEAVAAARTSGAGHFQGAILEAPGRWWDVVVTTIEAIEADAAVAPPGGRLLCVARDVTASRESEDRQRLLMQELTHRVKNTLALVQAIATQTLRGARTIEEARDALGARVAALAGAHDLLLQENWTTASLRRIVEGAASLHGGSRFDIDGPDVAVGPRAALSLALLFHELCTNAAKYGALTAPGGRVAVRWSVREGDAPDTPDAPGGPMLDLSWTESGGPPVTPPQRTGFGSRLIQRGLVQSFGGHVELTYPEAGVVMTLSAAVAALLGERV